MAADFQSLKAANAEIDRLNAWADSFSDAALKERALAEERIKAADAVLRQYGRHETTCAALMVTPKKCNCGWSAVFVRLTDKTSTNESTKEKA